MREQANDPYSPRRFVGLALVLATTLSTSACENDRYSVGTDARYCPEGRAAIPPGLTWVVPDDEPGIVEGFSFEGCSALPEKLRQECRLPAPLLSADVMSPVAKRHDDWSDVILSADLQALLQQKSVRMWLAAPDSVAILGSGGSKEWWLWELPAQSNNSPLESRLRASRLAAICGPAGHASTGYLTRADYVCRRSIATQNYAIDYQFGANTPTPSLAEMRSIDSGLTKEIESWRCR